MEKEKTNKKIWKSILIGTCVSLAVGGAGIGIGYAIWHKKPTKDPNTYKSLSLTGLDKLLIPFKTTYEYKCNVPTATITAQGLPVGFSFDGHILKTPESISAPGTFILTATTSGGLTCSRTISYFSGECSEGNKCILIEGDLVNPQIEKIAVSVEDGALSVVLTEEQKKTTTGVFFTKITETYNTTGEDFFANCTALTSIDLSPLSNVQSVGKNFLTSCSVLSSIDLSPLSNVQSVGDGFLNLILALTSIDLSPLSKVETIGNDFLGLCTTLTSIDLSPLSNVQSVGNSFLINCTGLSSIDLSPLSNVQSVGNSFLSYCIALTSIDLPPKVKNIGNDFLIFCKALTSIDLSPLSNVQSVGGGFLCSCPALTSVNIGNVDFTGVTMTDSDSTMSAVTNSQTNKILGAKSNEFKTKIDTINTNKPIDNWTCIQ